MRTILVVVLYLLFVGLASADDHEKKAKAAFAFEKLKDEAKSIESKQKKAETLFRQLCENETAPSPRPACQCHDTGVCKCTMGTCDCCKNTLPNYAEQREKAVKARLVIVAYFGTNGRGACFDGAISAGTTAISQPEIMVGYGDGSTVWLAEKLPADASESIIRDAVKRATERRDALLAPKPLVPAQPVQWFTQYTPVQVAPASATVCRT